MTYEGPPSRPLTAMQKTWDQVVLALTEDVLTDNKEAATFCVAMGSATHQEERDEWLAILDMLRSVPAATVLHYHDHCQILYTRFVDQNPKDTYARMRLRVIEQFQDFLAGYIQLVRSH